MHTLTYLYALYIYTICSLSHIWWLCLCSCVQRIQIIFVTHRGSAGYCFVELADEASVDRCVHRLNGKLVPGSNPVSATTVHPPITSQQWLICHFGTHSFGTWSVLRIPAELIFKNQVRKWIKPVLCVVWVVKVCAVRAVIHVVVVA